MDFSFTTPPGYRSGTGRERAPNELHTSGGRAPRAEPTTEELAALLKIDQAGADDGSVLWMRPSATGLVETLAELPDGYRVVMVGPGALVVGPTGLFVVGEGDQDANRIARRLAALAHQCRDTLADALEPAPFVDVLVMANDRREVDGASVVAPHMLIHALTAGPAMLDEELVEELATAIEQRRADIE